MTVEKLGNIVRNNVSVTRHKVCNQKTTWCTCDNTNVTFQLS